MRRFRQILHYNISVFVMATNQPRVQVLVVGQQGGTIIDGSHIAVGFWDRLRDFISSPLHASSQHVFSQIRFLLLIFGALFLLWKLYKNLKRIVDFISSLWVQSQPNQWLVVIRNGSFVKAGVGLKTFISPWDSVVRYPSRVQRISFLANNVTLQMQGVNIRGVAFWSVHRQGQGPFKCYKYMQGGDANQNVKTMCQSILRNLIANSKLDDVLKKRDLMKDTMRKELERPLKGWGIWLQSVEITEVRISSNTLFEQLQADFRNQTKIDAQRSEFESQQKINEQRQKTELKIAQLKQENQTKKDQQALTQQLERIKQKAKYEEQNNKFEIQKMQRVKTVEIQKLKITHQQEEEKIRNQMKIQKQKDLFDEEKIKRKIELDSLYKDVALNKYSIDTMERIYKNLEIKEMNINQFVGNEQSDLGRLLPTLGMINSLPVSRK